MAQTTVPQKLTARVTALMGRRGGAFPRVNSFLVRGPGGAVLIDPGVCHRKYLLGELGPVDAVIDSHYHPEHVSCNNELRAPVYVSALDLEAVRNFEGIRHRYGIADPAVESQWAQWLEEHALWKPTPGAEPLERLDIRALMGDDVYVLPAPGHTPGHIMIFFGGDGLLLSFDIDLVPQGPWFGHRGSNIDAWLDTMERAIILAPDSVASSHTAPVNRGFGTRSLQAYLERFHRREQDLLDFLAEPRTPHEINDWFCGYLYGELVPKPSRLWRHFAETTMENHLSRLLTYDAVKRLGETPAAAFCGK